jgi:hypothetical protein
MAQPRAEHGTTEISNVRRGAAFIMRNFAWLVSLSLGGLAIQTVNFDSARPGTLPAGWTAVMAHAGAPPKWEVVQDPTAPSPPYVFAQVSNDRDRHRLPLAILNKVNVTDGELSVRLKLVSGHEDRAGGLVWRYRDPENYYLVRADALGNQITLYKMQDGKMTALPLKGGSPDSYGVAHPVPANQWSVLKVQFRGPLFSVYFNHRRLFQVVDSTFQHPGQVGLSTKDDSVIYFDDFRVTGK